MKGNALVKLEITWRFECTCGAIHRGSYFPDLIQPEQCPQCGRLWQVMRTASLLTTVTAREQGRRKP